MFPFKIDVKMNHVNYPAHVTQVQHISFKSLFVSQNDLSLL